MSTKTKNCPRQTKLMMIKYQFLKETHMVKNSFNYFIGYNNDDDVIRLLQIKFPQMVGYVKHFQGNKTMSFTIIDNKLLKEYIKYGKGLEV